MGLAVLLLLLLLLPLVLLLLLPLNLPRTFIIMVIILRLTIIMTFFGLGLVLVLFHQLVVQRHPLLILLTQLLLPPVRIRVKLVVRILIAVKINATRRRINARNRGFNTFSYWYFGRVQVFRFWCFDLLFFFNSFLSCY